MYKILKSISYSTHYILFLAREYILTLYHKNSYIKYSNLDSDLCGIKVFTYSIYDTMNIIITSNFIIIVYCIVKCHFMN